jgi:hypothetical protein
MREAEQPKHAPQAEERATEAAERPWADLVQGLLDDQFREFAEEAHQPQRDEQQTNLAQDG